MSEYRRNTGRPRRRGLTLLELLAVLVLFTLTAGVAGVRLVATSTHAKLGAVASRLRDLDAHARLLARGGQLASMQLHEQGLVQLHAIPSGEMLASVAMPTAFAVELQTSTGEAVIRFDRLGRSQDYRVALLAGETNRRWHVYGLTGYIRVDQTGAVR